MSTAPAAPGAPAASTIPDSPASDTDAVDATGELVELLAAKAAAGDWDSMSTLYEQYFDQTYKWAHMRTRNHAIAEDISSDVWHRVIRGIKSFISHGPGSFVKWLFTITRRLLIDYSRSNRGDGREQITADMLKLDRPSGESTPDEIVELADERRQTAALLARALRRIPDRQAECLKLRFYLGLSLDDAAVALGLNRNATKQLQHRALTQLRSAMTTTETIEATSGVGATTVRTLMPVRPLMADEPMAVAS